jgi:putative ABC exporter
VSTGALRYLTIATSRNRTRARLRRLRQPRYAAAFVLGALYLWTFLLRPQGTSSAPAADILGTTAEMLAAVGIMILVASAWLSTGARQALAYTNAEINFLFTGPLTRRSLLVYKLVRAQIVVAFNALLWVFLLRRGGSSLAAPLRAVSVWLFFNTLFMHRLGAALTRVSWQEHGRAGIARQRVTLAVLILVAVAIGWSLIRDVPPALSGESVTAIRAVIDALATRPASWAMAPIHWLVRPTFAATTGDWLRTIWPAFLLLGLHLVWVLRADVAFEEAALVASSERAERLKRFRDRTGSRPVVSPKRGARTLPLSPVGPAAIGIVWKNTLGLIRATRPAGLLAVVFIALPMALAVSKIQGGNMVRFIAVMATTAVAALALLGPRVIRNDLRLDMLHLESLKTLPLSGRRLVAAEVASSALPLTAIQVTLLLLALVLTLGDPIVPLATPMRVAIVAGAAPALLLFNLAALAVQNGAAVLFPAWTRLGNVTSGVEVLGQGLLALLGSAVVLLIVLLPPAIVVVSSLRPAIRAGVPGILVMAVSGAALLAAEVVGIVLWLGRAFDKAEPQQIQ